MTTIVTAGFVADKLGEESEFPQMAAPSSSLAFQSVYWRCLYVLFSSSIRLNRSARHILFCNTQPPVVDGVDIGAALSALGVEVVELPFKSRPPQGFMSEFENTHYFFDILSALEELDCRRIVFLDADCIFLRPAEHFEPLIDEVGIVTYEWPVALGKRIVGTTREDIQEVARDVFGVDVDQPPPICGGEFFAATKPALAEFNRLAREFWPINLERWSAGKTCVYTEQHIIALIMCAQRWPVGLANDYVARVWTHLRSNNISANTTSMHVLHLPAEKSTGFRYLYDDAIQRDSLYWSLNEDDWRGYVLRRLGLPRRSKAKLAKDVFHMRGRLMSKLQQRLLQAIQG